MRCAMYSRSHRRAAPPGPVRLVGLARDRPGDRPADRADADRERRARRDRRVHAFLGARVPGRGCEPLRISGPPPDPGCRASREHPRSPSRSPRYREFLRPYGFDGELISANDDALAWLEQLAPDPPESARSGIDLPLVAATTLMRASAVAADRTLAGLPRLLPAEQAASSATPPWSSSRRRRPRSRRSSSRPTDSRAGSGRSRSSLRADSRRPRSPSTCTCRSTPCVTT